MREPRDCFISGSCKTISHIHVIVISNYIFNGWRNRFTEYAIDIILGYEVYWATVQGTLREYLARSNRTGVQHRVQCLHNKVCIQAKAMFHVVTFKLVSSCTYAIDTRMCSNTYPSRGNDRIPNIQRFCDLTFHLKKLEYSKTIIGPYKTEN